MPTTARMFAPRASAVLGLLLLPAFARCGATFRVSVDPAARSEPCTGRLIVYLINEKSPLAKAALPADAPFFEDPQPMFGLDVRDLKPADVAIVDDSAASFPVKASALPDGKYIAQAVLDMHNVNSRWEREPGNVYSEPVKFAIKSGELSTVDLKLAKVVEPRTAPVTKALQIVEVPSKLLSDFHGRPTVMRAGVVFPRDYDPKRSYPAVYEIPGFGGDAYDAVRHASRPPAPDASDPRERLAREAFWIVLDPESGNGHTLFANSDNNGPCGDALARELIPALEQKFNLTAKPQARFLRGHSSGGWSSIWLQLQYPDVFGGAWASSPDPVDLHKFQLVDIYGADDMYSDGKRDWPSVREGTMTIRQENAMEEVLGPGNTSGQQWDSWQAAWGSRDASGKIAPLYDAITGKLDAKEAQNYRRYDISDLLARDPQKYGPIFKERIRLIVGGQDTFFLNEAVAMLKPQADKLPGAGAGYIKILPGFDHGSIHAAPEFRAIPKEMLEQLRRVKHDG